MKTQPTIIIIISLIVISGIGFFLIRPVATSLLASWKELENARNNQKTIQEKRAVLDELKQNSDLSRIDEIAKKYIPSTDESGQLVLELSAIAQSQNLKVEETSLEKSQTAAQTPAPETQAATPENQAPLPTQPAAETIEKVDFSIKVSGSFQSFMSFLYVIETSTRLITLQSISMQAKTEQDLTNFSAQIKGNAYYKKNVDLNPDSENFNNIKISQEITDRFLELKTYGQPIELPEETGFGRTNPFEEY